MIGISQQIIEKRYIIKHFMQFKNSYELLVLYTFQTFILSTRTVLNLNWQLQKWLSRCKKKQMSGIYSRNTSIIATEIQIPGNKRKFTWRVSEAFLSLPLSVSNNHFRRSLDLPLYLTERTMRTEVYSSSCIHPTKKKDRAPK